MKKTKKKYLIILLIVLLLGLAVGYAAFSDTLSITGTANANGSFDMQFTACTVSNAQGVKTVHATAGDDITEGVISNDGDLLTLKCVDLAYPGAGAQYNITITNVGTIPAKVNGLTNQTNVTGNGAIVIDGLTLPGNHSTTIAPGGTCEFSVTIKWDPAHTQPLTAAEQTVSFGLDINYEQDTTAFNGAAAHGV